MIKRLIFDVDDTLIPWEQAYYMDLIKVLKKNDIKLSKFRMLITSKAIDNYEKHHERWEKFEFMDYITKKSKVQITEERFDMILKWLENCVYGKAPKEMVDTLEYLSKKYELVVLSNSFKSVQVNRLKKYGILKYFKEIYCGDEYMKPTPKSYLTACGKYKPSECIMIGDNIRFDIKEPLKLGLDVIYITKKKNKKYKTSEDVTGLKDIL